MRVIKALAAAFFPERSSVMLAGIVSGAEVVDLAVHRVLEDDAAQDDGDGETDGARECERGCGGSDVFLGAEGLQRHHRRHVLKAAAGTDD